MIARRRLASRGAAAVSALVDGRLEGSAAVSMPQTVGPNARGGKPRAC